MATPDPPTLDDDANLSLALYFHFGVGNMEEAQRSSPFCRFTFHSMYSDLTMALFAVKDGIWKWTRAQINTRLLHGSVAIIRTRLANSEEILMACTKGIPVALLFLAHLVLLSDLYDGKTFHCYSQEQLETIRVLLPRHCFHVADTRFSPLTPMEKERLAMVMTSGFCRSLEPLPAIAYAFSSLPPKTNIDEHTFVIVL